MYKYGSLTMWPVLREHLESHVYDKSANVLALHLYLPSFSLFANMHPEQFPFSLKQAAKFNSHKTKWQAVGVR